MRFPQIATFTVAIHNDQGACMGSKANYPEALVIESLTQAIRGAAFAIPGALGAQEGGLVAICAIFGVSAQAAVAMSLIKRVPDLVFGAPSLGVGR